MEKLALAAKDFTNIYLTACLNLFWPGDGMDWEIGTALLLLLSRFSRVRLCATPQTAAHQAPLSLDSPGKNTGVGCHFLLHWWCCLPIITNQSEECPQVDHALLFDKTSHDPLQVGTDSLRELIYCGPLCLAKQYIFSFPLHPNCL